MYKIKIKTFKAFAYIIEYAKSLLEGSLTNESLFLDAGSGIGKAVFAASLVYPFKKCIGIEALEELDTIGVKYLEHFDFKKILEDKKDLFPLFITEKKNDINIVETKEENVNEQEPKESNMELLIPEIGLKCGNFLEENWGLYDIIFVNSTTFDHDLMNQITIKSKEMKSNSILITVTKRILEAPDNRWKLYDGFRQQMNFGSATVYFHKVREIKLKDMESRIGDSQSMFNPKKSIR